MLRSATAVIVLALLTSACAGGDSAPVAADASADEAASTEPEELVPADDVVAGGTSSFVAEVWVDNWFALHVNGELVGEDSVPITTERSFNAETITFDATWPLTIAVVTKDFKEDDTGLEYIGTDRQQMGDGGFIAQITDTSTGEVVAVTSEQWQALVIHRAPLDKSCESSSTPQVDCTFEVVDEPDGWELPGFDDSAWTGATVWTDSQVDPKGGYDEIQWDGQAALIWTDDLEADNTILWRIEVG